MSIRRLLSVLLVCFITVMSLSTGQIAVSEGTSTDAGTPVSEAPAPEAPAPEAPAPEVPAPEVPAPEEPAPEEPAPEEPAPEEPAPEEPAPEEPAPEEPSIPIVNTDEASAELAEAESSPALEETNDFIIENGVLINYKGTDTKVKIPDDVKKIGRRAFYENNKLTSIDLNQVEEIEEEAFANCKKLDRVRFDEGKLHKIGKRAFAGCVALTPFDTKDIECASEVFIDCAQLITPDTPEATSNLLPEDVESTPPNNDTIPMPEATMGETPITETPAPEATAGETPAPEEPAGETPIDEVPVPEATAGEVPAPEEPAGETPIDEVPVPEATAGEIPVPEEPAGETPIDEIPVPEATAGEIPVPEEPAAEPPIDEIPVPEATAAEAPAPEEPAGETPIDEIPVPEATAGETPAPEEPAGETPVTEAPAPEATIGETPVTEAPAPEATAGEAPEVELQVETTNYFIIENGILVGYTGPDANVKVPDDVKTIGYRAFYQNKELGSIDLNQVEEIEEEAFAGCEKLSSVQFDTEKLCEIGKRAFAGCTALSPFYTEEISCADDAFADCATATAPVSSETTPVLLPEIVESTPFAITVQPADREAQAGVSVTFSLTAGGTGLTYQWQYKAPAGTSWANSYTSGYSTNAITVTATVARNGQQYRCIVKDGSGNSITSNSATLIIASGSLITKQPEDQSGIIGSSVTFTLSAGTDATYQWQYKAPGGTTWSNSYTTGFATNALTVSVTAARNGQQYRCVVKDGSGNSETSNAATLNVASSALQITTQPTDQSGNIGSSVTFKLEATGTGLTYQWQYMAPSATNWSNSYTTGYATNALTVSVTAARNGQQYRCIVSNAGGQKLTSNAVALIVTTSGELKITTQPADQSGVIGSNVTFRLEAMGTGLTYQWQYKASGSSTWFNSYATGYNTNALGVGVLDYRNGQQYRCVVSDSIGQKLTSSEATLNVITSSITKQPADQTGAIGVSVNFTVETTGTGLTYRWQYKAPNSTSWSYSYTTGYATNTLTVVVNAAREGQQYRCVVTNSDGANEISDAATLHAETSQIITVQPTDQSGAVGSNVTFAVDATGTGLTYQWQYKAPSSSTWFNSYATGYDTKTLGVSVLDYRNGQQYRCAVTDSQGVKEISNAATLHVDLTVVQQPEDMNGFVGETVTFSLKATGAGLKYQWQYQTVGTTNWSNSFASGYATDALTISVTAARDGQKYRCVVTDANGIKTESQACALIVDLAISKQPEDVSGSVGSNVVISLEATGAGVKYQWQYKPASSETWTNSYASGYSTNSLTVGVTVARNGQQYRCVVTDRHAVTLMSEPSTLTLDNSVDIVCPETVYLLSENALAYNVGDLLESATNLQLSISAKVGEEVTQLVKENVTVKESTVKFAVAESNVTLGEIDTVLLVVKVFDDTTEYYNREYTAAVDSTFTSVDNVKYQLANGIVTIVSYTGTASTLAIPETMNGFTVTIVGESAFEANTTLTSIDLPDTIVTISKRAFAQCTSLSEMN